MLNTTSLSNELLTTPELCLWYVVQHCTNCPRVHRHRGARTFLWWSREHQTDSSVHCPWTGEKCKLYQKSIVTCTGEPLHIYAPSLVGTWTLNIRETRGANNIQLQRPHANFYRKSFQFNGLTVYTYGTKKHLGRLFGSICFILHNLCIILLFCFGVLY